MRVRALPLALLVTLLAAGAVAQPYNLASVSWVKYLKLSGGNDLAHGTCTFGDYLAVVGKADNHPALVLLDKSTGEVVKKWVSGEYGVLFNCLSVGDALYTAGFTWSRGTEEGIIYAFDKDLNVIGTAYNPRTSYYYAIIYDGEFLYSSGNIYEDIDGDGKVEEVWYIEKRTKSLELVKSRELYAGGWKSGLISPSVGINPATGELWAVGYYYSNTTRSLIVIFDRELRELRRVDYPIGRGTATISHIGICFDNIGNVFVAGWYGVANFDKSGRILKVNEDISSSDKIICANGLVYVFSNIYVRHFLDILDSGLNLVETHVLSKNVNASLTASFFPDGKPCFDGRNIYVAGIDNMLGNYRWVIYSITVKPLPPITVAVEGLPSSYSIPVYVNGAFYSYVQGGGSMVLNVSEVNVTVKVEKTVVGTNDTVYEAANDALTVSPGERAVFRYTVAKFYVKVVSNLAPAFGSGWYRRGDEARVGLEGLKDGYYYASDEKVRYRFEGWEVRKGNFSAPSAPSFSLSVAGPVVVEARFGPPEYKVCIDSACSYYREGYTVPPGQDVPELGGLLIRRFEGYIDANGKSLGKSFTVNRPISATSAYRLEANLPLLAAILVVLVLPVIAGALKTGRKTEREAGAGGGEAVAEREPGWERELARVEGYLARLEELRREGRVSEEAYRRLREEYERERERLRELKPAQQAERPTLRTCPRCGAPVEPEAKYCWRCGAKL